MLRANDFNGRLKNVVRLATFALLGLALGAGTVTAADERVPTPDLALKQHALEIIKYLRDHKYGNVGVLKFLVKQGDKSSDNVGPLNLNLADRLEVALVLANPDENLMILEKASNAVLRAKNRRATHLTPEGRSALFQIRDQYMPAWGDKEPVQADAFLTGIVEFKPDLKQMNITVQAFDRKSKEPETICSFPASTDFRTLAETGRSYRLAGARGPDEGELLAQAVDNAAETELKRRNPLDPPVTSPVELKVLYDGKEVPLKSGIVREPREGESVHFVLVNNDPDERYGVVLKINGENTIYLEKDEPLSCHKWILKPKQQVTIRGFQKKKDSPLANDKADMFKVRSPEQSEKDAVYYGEHAGTFSMIVFRENKTVKDMITQAPPEIAAIAKGTLTPSGRRPGTLVALQSILKERGEKAKDNAGSKGGMIVPGEETKNPVVYETFKTDPVPVVIATVRYWLPTAR